MNKAWLMGSAAAVALVAATGAAQAADVMPIVVPVVTPVAVPVPGPVKVVQIETSLSGYGPASPLYLDTAGAVDIRTTSGWGFQLMVGNSLSFDGPPVSGRGTLGGRVYRAIGNATVGVVASVDSAYTFGGPVIFGPLGVGVDADYHTESLNLYYALTAGFAGGGFTGFESLFAASIERGNFRMDTISTFSFPFPGLTGLAGAAFGYAFGPVTPYILVIGGLVPAPQGAVGAGLKFEHEIGESLTINANVQAAISTGSVVSWNAVAGFEYTLGGGDGPLSLRGSVGTGVGGLSWEVGIGLKFGEGRVTGINGLILDGLPGLLDGGL